MDTFDSVEFLFEKRRRESDKNLRENRFEPFQQVCQGVEYTLHFNSPVTVIIDRVDLTAYHSMLCSPTNSNQCSHPFSNDLGSFLDQADTKRILEHRSSEVFCKWPTVNGEESTIACFQI